MGGRVCFSAQLAQFKQKPPECFGHCFFRVTNVQKTSQRYVKLSNVLVLPIWQAKLTKIILSL
jgi:hypothetical protein